MAINPLIALGAAQVETPFAAFQEGRERKREREAQEKRNRLTDLYTQQAEREAAEYEKNAPVREQDAILKRLQNMNALEEARVTATARRQQRLHQFLERGDIEGARRYLQEDKARIGRIREDGKDILGYLPDTRQTDAALAALDTDPEGLKSAIESELAIWRQAGILPAAEAPKTREVKRGDQVVTEQFNPATGEFEQIGEAPRFNQDNQLVEVADPSSPTGTRMVRREQAAGMPGKPASGFAFEMDKDGTMRITQGRDAQNGLSKTTQGNVEEKILKAGDTLAQLTSIKARAKPEFQQIGTRFGMKWNALQDKINPALLSKEEQRSLAEFTQYRADAGQLFALTLKDLSGVAVNPTEFKRAEQWLPNPGSGIFDGDSPTQLQAKADRFEDFTRKALMKYAYIKQHGLTVNDVDVDEMPVLMNQRGDELEQEYRREGIPDDQIARLVKMRLADEFGLVSY